MKFYSYKLRLLQGKLFVAAIALLFGPKMAFPEFYINDEGWSVAVPSADSRIIYVSSSEGSDSNDGLSPQSPKATFAAGESLLRNGEPDHLLLKRGDVFTASALNRWKNGRNATERMVISYYGDSGPRPVIELSSMLIDHNGDVRNHLAFIGIDFYRPSSDPQSSRFNNSSSSSVFRFIGGGANITIEDCKFRFCRTVIQSWQSPGSPEQTYVNFHFRRNIVTDVWVNNSTPPGGSGYSHTAGIYMSGVLNYVMEENFYDHNGWSTHSDTTLANMFSHNVYIQRDNGPGGIIRGNIAVRGAAHGIQARSGGVVERNLFAENAIGFNIGGVGTPTYEEEVWGFDNRGIQNVVLAGRRMHPVNSSYPLTNAVWGIVGAYVGEISYFDNIVANRTDSGNNNGIHARTAEQPVSLLLADNIVHNWSASLGDVRDTFDPSWPNPNATLGDYYASIGGTNNTHDYYQTLRERGPGEFPWELTSYAAISFIRNGFNRSAVGGYYDYGSPNAIAATGVSVNKESLEISGGETAEIIATVTPVDAHNQGIIWSTANANVAVVNDYGIVEVRGPGTTEITATTRDGGFSASTTVTVSGFDAPTHIEINPQLLNRIPAGQERTLTAIISPATASQVVTWSSSDENVATVNEFGVVTMIAAGAATITATTEGPDAISATANVIVIGGTPAPQLWAGFNISDGKIQTGANFLGTLDISEEPWIHGDDLNQWIYLPEANVSNEGAWGFVLTLESFIPSESPEWFITLPLQNWLHTTESAGAQWVFFTNGGQ